MAILIPGIDVKKGLELYDGDEDIFLIVLRSFASNTPAVLDKMREVTDATLSDYAVAVHGVKGSSAAVGAEEVRKNALKLEELAKAGDLAGVQARNEAFLKLTDDLIFGIRNWLDQFDPG